MELGKKLFNKEELLLPEATDSSMETLLWLSDLELDMLGILEKVIEAKNKWEKCKNPKAVAIFQKIGDEISHTSVRSEIYKRSYEVFKEALKKLPKDTKKLVFAFNAPNVPNEKVTLGLKGYPSVLNSNDISRTLHAHFINRHANFKGEDVDTFEFKPNFYKDLKMLNQKLAAFSEEEFFKHNGIILTSECIEGSDSCDFYIYAEKKE